MGSDHLAGLVAMQTIEKVIAEFGVNITMGASNISFGLPDRKYINATFIAMAIHALWNGLLTLDTEVGLLSGRETYFHGGFAVWSGSVDRAALRGRGPRLAPRIDLLPPRLLPHHPPLPLLAALLPRLDQRRPPLLS